MGLPGVEGFDLDELLPARMRRGDRNTHFYSPDYLVYIGDKVPRYLYHIPKGKAAFGKPVYAYPIREVEAADTFGPGYRKGKYVWLSRTLAYGSDNVYIIDLMKLDNNNLRHTGQVEGNFLHRGDIPADAVVGIIKRNKVFLPPSKSRQSTRPRSAGRAINWNLKKTDLPYYDNMLKDPEYYKRVKGVVGVIEYMPPLEYMNKVADLHLRPLSHVMDLVDRKLVKQYKERMLAGDVFPIPVLSYHLYEQEGRHRACAALDLKAAQIPVFVVRPVGKVAPMVSKKPGGSSPYQGGWQQGDFAIYSDFGLRSLYIVRILPWPKDEGDRFTEHHVGASLYWTMTYDWRAGDVRAEVVDTTLVDWDFKWRGEIASHQKEGTIHYYYYGNLYRNIEELIAKEKRLLYPEVLVRMLYDLRAHPGWIMLAAYGLRNDKGAG